MLSKALWFTSSGGSSPRTPGFHGWGFSRRTADCCLASLEGSGSVTCGGGVAALMAVAYDSGAPFGADDVALDGVVGGGGSGDMPATVAGGVIVAGIPRGTESDRRRGSMSLSRHNSSSLRLRMLSFVSSRDLGEGMPSIMVTRCRLASSRRTSSKNVPYPPSWEPPSTICLQLWFRRCHLMASVDSKVSKVA